MTKYKALRLGPLPTEQIRITLGNILEPGDVWVSKAAHKHIAEDHPTDYPRIIHEIPNMLANPHYIGIETKHPDNFYLVNIIDQTDPKAGLVAIGFDQNQHGGYNVRSSYRIKRKDVDSRLQKRLLTIVKL